MVTRLRRFWGFLPRISPESLVTKQIEGSRTRYTICLSDLENGGPFGINRRLFLPFVRALFCHRSSKLQSAVQLQSVGLSSQNKDNKQSSLSHQSQSHRNYSGENGDNNPGKRPGILRLMNMREVIWPHPMKSMKNKFFSMLIRGYFDENYSPEEFLQGAEQAVAYVSSMVSEGKFDALEGLVTRDAIREIRQNYHDLSVKQRQFLAVNTADLFFRFIYEIGMIFDDETDERFVEITTVFQGIHGFSEFRESEALSFAEEMERSGDLVYVCNYRFSREYTKGNEAEDWTINKLNHFSPKETANNTSMFQR